MINKLLKNNKISKSNNSWIALFLLLLFFLSVSYCSWITNICTVWELPDEYGYLANAEYFSLKKWVPVTTSYYGFGYSLLLVPLFHIFGHGVNVIKGAIFINTICVLIAYFLITRLAIKLYPRLSKVSIVFIAFTLSIFPGLFANSFKVFSESLLYLLIWLIWNIFYDCIHENKTIKYILLALVLSWSFFVHTRSIAIIVTMGMLLFLLIFTKDKRLNVKNIIICIFSLILFVILGYCVKQELLSEVYTLPLVENGSKNATYVNTINGNWIIERIKWFFSEDFFYYLISLCCKMFYLGVSTCGIAYISIIIGIRKLYKIIKYKEIGDDSNFIESGFFISFAVMIVAVLFAGAGMLDNVSFFFYGRYYEYLVPELVLMGLASFITNKEMKNVLNIVPLVWLFSVIGSISLTKFITNNRFVLDTNRIAGFSLITNEYNNYSDAIIRLYCLGTLLLILVIIISRIKHKEIVLIPLMLFFALSNNMNIKTIVDNNNVSSRDNEIIYYLEEECNYKDIYFLKTEYKYDYGFTRLIALIDSANVIIINEDDIETIPDGVLFIGYNDLLSQTDLNCEMIATGGFFGLYQR